MDKRYNVVCTKHGQWFVEMQEGESAAWVIIAGPFNTDEQAWDALDKLRED